MGRRRRLSNQIPNFAEKLLLHFSLGYAKSLTVSRCSPLVTQRPDKLHANARSNNSKRQTSADVYRHGFRDLTPLLLQRICTRNHNQVLQPSPSATRVLPPGQEPRKPFPKILVTSRSPSLLTLVVCYWFPPVTSYGYKLVGSTRCKLSSTSVL